jgi:hypothetical protein
MEKMIWVVFAMCMHGVQSQDLCNSNLALLRQVSETYLRPREEAILDFSELETETLQMQGRLEKFEESMDGWDNVTGISYVKEDDEAVDEEFYSSMTTGYVVVKREETGAKAIKNCLGDFGTFLSVTSQNMEELKNIMLRTQVASTFINVEIGNNIIFSPKDGSVLATFETAEQTAMTAGMLGIAQLKGDGTLEIGVIDGATSKNYVCLRKQDWRGNGIISQLIRGKRSNVRKAITKFYSWVKRFKKIMGHQHDGKTSHAYKRLTLKPDLGLNILASLVNMVINQVPNELGHREYDFMEGIVRGLDRFMQGHKLTTNGIRTQVDLTPDDNEDVTTLALLEPKSRNGMDAVIDVSSYGNEISEKIVVYKIVTILKPDLLSLKARVIVTMGRQAYAGTAVTFDNCATTEHGRTLCSGVGIVNKHLKCGELIYNNRGLETACEKEMREVFEVIKPTCAKYSGGSIVISTARFSGVLSCENGDSPILVKLGVIRLNDTCRLKDMAGVTAGSAMHGHNGDITFTVTTERTDMSEKDWENLKEIGLANLFTAKGIMILIGFTLGAISCIAVSGIALYFGAKKAASCYESKYDKETKRRMMRAGQRLNRFDSTEMTETETEPPIVSMGFRKAIGMTGRHKTAY